MMAEPEPEPEQAHCSTLQAEVLVTTLRKIQDTNLENQSLAWQHRKARSQVLAAQRALDHAKAAARGKHGGRTAPTVNQIGLLKRKLADAETTLVNSMKRVERRHAPPVQATAELEQQQLGDDEAVRAGNIVLRTAEALKHELGELQGLRKHASEVASLRQEKKAAAGLVEAAAQRETRLEIRRQEDEATIEQLRARLAESEANGEPLYALAAQLRQQNDGLRAEVSELTAQGELRQAEREAMEAQIRTEARGRALAEVETSQLSQQLAEMQSTADRELAEREAELHRLYAAQLMEADIALAEPEEKAAALHGEVSTLRTQLQETIEAKDDAERRVVEGAEAQAEVQSQLEASVIAVAANMVVPPEESEEETEEEEEEPAPEPEPEPEPEPLLSPEDLRRIERVDPAKNANLTLGKGDVAHPPDSVAAQIADERRKLAELKQRVVEPRWVAQPQMPAANAIVTRPGRPGRVGEMTPAVAFTRSHRSGITLSADGSEASRTGQDDGTLQAAASVGNMRQGKHFAEFTAIRGVDMCFGVIRPGWDVESSVDAWQVEGHCMYSSRDGTNCPGQGLGGRDWEGRQFAAEGSRIGMLLDLDEGTMSVYKNGTRLGVMASSGLSGDYCWAVTLLNEGDCARIIGKPLPPLAAPQRAEVDADPWRTDSDEREDGAYSMAPPQQQAKGQAHHRRRGVLTLQPAADPTAALTDQAMSQQQPGSMEQDAIAAAASAIAAAVTGAITVAQMTAGVPSASQQRTDVRGPTAYPVAQQPQQQGQSAIPLLAQCGSLLLNAASQWVQFADGAGEPCFYHMETAEISWTPPREGVLRVE